jgi:hypothetical protein
MRARRPDLHPLRQVSVEDVENCFYEGYFYQKNVKFSPKWVNINLCTVLQFSKPLLLNFFILRLPYWPHNYSLEKNQVPRELTLIAISIACLVAQ